jgi:hypothetical protein
LKPYHINYLDGTRAPIDVKIIDINWYMMIYFHITTHVHECVYVKMWNRARTHAHTLEIRFYILCFVISEY